MSQESDTPPPLEGQLLVYQTADGKNYATRFYNLDAIISVTELTFTAPVGIFERARTSSQGMLAVPCKLNGAHNHE